LTAVGATGGGAAGASSVVLGGVAAKAAAIVVAGVVVGGGTYAGVARVERPAARSAERPAAVRVHVAPNASRREPIASARTFETPKSEAPAQTYGRTKARLNPPGVAVRAAISKPAAVPRGQIVKALVHDLQPLRSGPAARAAGKTRKATQTQAHTKQTMAKQTKAQNTQQRAERPKPAHPTRANAKPAATTEVVVPRGRQKTLEPKTIEPKTIEPKTPKPTP
jgi:hypothetical protein